MTRPELTTQRLKLRIYAPQDAAEMYSHITPTLTRFMAWEPPASYEEFLENKPLWEERFLKGTDYHFVARDIRSGRYIGIVGVHRATTTTPEFGVWMCEDVHGQGFGKEAVTAVFGWAKEMLQADYFVYPVAEENRASRKIAETLGGKLVSSEQKPKYMAVTYHIPA
ncbi:GNAT family N-acetyltransferase [Pseudochrobactrum saccharolyticum]|uniref:GNAT family N-acetyltransferase n=1 Tax=Pseudochrobactrum saccharolyticum TaxID=354352 RepID=UPI00274B995C|nr:GNAT family N-acetyltransferase [Pseudochrobactrum saccharolyticum]MDP8249507.1 GNAT family N-acetyltransferase [Pseudochrobactrum saccharolyticum]